METFELTNKIDKIEHDSFCDITEKILCYSWYIYHFVCMLVLCYSTAIQILKTPRSLEPTGTSPINITKGAIKAYVTEYLQSLATATINMKNVIGKMFYTSKTHYRILYIIVTVLI